MLRRVIDRPRRRHFRASKAVIAMLAFTVLGLTGIWLTQDWHYQARAQEAVEELELMRTAGAPVQDLNEENQVLREKLERSSKVTTSETTRELVRFYIRKYFPESEWGNAEKISKCESGQNPLSVNDKNTNGSTDRGLWQINSVHAKRFQSMYGIAWETGAHDIEMSTRYARFLYDHSGWGPWVCKGVL